MPLTIDYRNSNCISVTDYSPELGETSIIIPDGVHQVSADVFSGYHNLESITFPESIRLIEDRAFKGCSNLKEVRFIGHPDLFRVCKDAFDDCPKLVVESSFIAIGDVLFKYIGNEESVTIPACFHRIASAAFDESAYDYIDREDYLENASRLKGVQIKTLYLPDSITKIDDRAFFQCTKLRSINIPPQITVIEESTFYGCESLEGITLPAGLESIKSSAFEGCINLSSINLPEGMKEIDVFAFCGCAKLRSLSLPNSLEIYGLGAFAGTQLESVTGVNVKKVYQPYWQHGEEPICIFPKVSIGRGIKPYSCLLLALGYCFSSNRYDIEVAKTYNRYIQKNGMKLISFAKERGLEGVEDFCLTHGYRKPVVSQEGDMKQQLLEGVDNIPLEIDLNNYPDDFNGGNLPSNRDIKAFVARNFFVYSTNGVCNAACYGRNSMVICILLLDGVLKSIEFHNTKNSNVFGSWFSMLYEG